MSVWNKKIFNFSYGAFGLDLSDLSVKVVQMKDKRGKEGFESDPVGNGNSNRSGSGICR